MSEHAHKFLQEDIPLSQSPLLSGPVKIRSYVNNMAPPSPEVAASREEPKSEPAQNPPQESNRPESGPSNSGFDRPPAQTEEEQRIPHQTPEMDFDEKRPLGSEDDGDGDGDGDDSFQLPEIDAKTFAEGMVDAYNLEVPRILFENFGEIDMNNILLHVGKGSLNPIFIQTFQQVNKNSLEAMSLEEGEIKLAKKLWTKAFKSQKISWATPLNAAIAFTIVLGIRQASTMRKVRKSSQQLVHDAIRLSNPHLFDNKEQFAQANTNLREQEIQNGQNQNQNQNTVEA